MSPRGASAPVTAGEGRGAWATPDAALVVAGVSAFLFLLGFSREQAYFGRMGIRLGEIGFPTETYLYVGFLASLPLLLNVLLGFLLAPAVGRLLRRPMPRGLPLLVLLLAAAGFATLGGALEAWETGAEVTLGPFALPFGWAQLAVTALLDAVALAGFAGMASLRGPGRPAEEGLGPRHALLAAFFVLCAVSTGALLGLRAAGDALWCVGPYDVATVDEGEGNRTYLFVAHANGGYYLRSFREAGSAPPAHRFVPEERVEHVRIARVVGPCPTEGLG